MKLWKKLKEWLQRDVIPKGLKISGPGILFRSSKDILNDPRSERQIQALRRLSERDKKTNERQDSSTGRP